MTNPPAVYSYSTRQAGSQDADLWHEISRIFAGFEKSAYANELSSIFDNLHDEELLEALEKTRWTGRPGHPVRVMWRTAIAMYILNIPTIQELIRTLHRNPFMAFQCGIHSDKEVPTRFACYRFTKKLIAHRELIEQCMAKTIEALQSQLPEFGKIVAMDSTHVPTYANRFTKTPSDKDARWGKKKDRDDDEMRWLGYKMHIVSDATHEIPLMPIVTPANQYDSPMMIPLLRKNKELLNGFAPEIVLADAGYDAKENYRVVVEDFKAIPMIDLNLRAAKNKRNTFEDIADDYGTPHCAWGVPMVFWGYDKKQKRLKYRCPQACGKKGCTWLDKCSKSAYGHVVKVNLKDDYRKFIQVPRRTPGWKKLYDKRTSIERIFSRLKKDGDGKLVSHRIRGLEKMTLNCLFSVWVMQARALSTDGRISR